MNSPAKPNSPSLIKDAVRAQVESLPAENDESQAIYELEKARLEVDKLKLENQTLAEGVNDRQADRMLRERYANYAFNFLRAFSIFCGLILLAQGIPGCPFKLGENIVVTLIGATAAAVIGLVGWVAKGLFKAPG